MAKQTRHDLERYGLEPHLTIQHLYYHRRPLPIRFRPSSHTFFFFLNTTRQSWSAACSPQAKTAGHNIKVRETGSLEAPGEHGCHGNHRQHGDRACSYIQTTSGHDSGSVELFRSTTSKQKRNTKHEDDKSRAGLTIRFHLLPFEAAAAAPKQLLSSTTWGSTRRVMPPPPPGRLVSTACSRKRDPIPQIGAHASVFLVIRFLLVSTTYIWKQGGLPQKHIRKTYTDAAAGSNCVYRDLPARNKPLVCVQRGHQNTPPHRLQHVAANFQDRITLPMGCSPIQQRPTESKIEGLPSCPWKPCPRARSCKRSHARR